LTQLDGWGVAAAAAAAIAFAAMILGAVMIWRPLPGVFALDAGILIGSYVEGDPPATVAEMHRDLAVHLGRHAKRNADELQKRLGWFTFALVAFVVEIAALIALL